ncbi:hypothetical protein [Sinorhizobium medicae]
MPAIQEAEPLTEEDLNLFEIAAQATSDELPSNDDQEPVGNLGGGAAEEALSEGLKQLFLKD